MQGISERGAMHVRSVVQGWKHPIPVKGNAPVSSAGKEEVASKAIEPISKRHVNRTGWLPL
ncbi:hypothetical protein [Paenibacillus turpanensis]|uniref:hypothetical protein n=1 Tax=Paenibacillus turpanensis TaxID=2689078 RepID=UPI001408B071|nr:hypothetical protein [Paenibacillus turpanensis]